MFITRSLLLISQDHYGWLGLTFFKEIDGSDVF